VQGINYIVAILLFYIQDEELVFWCLYQVMNKLNMRQVYKVGFPKLALLNEHMSERLEQEHPRLLEHLRDNSLGVENTFVSAFMTFSIDKCPLEISTRLFEVFLIDGDSGYLNCLIRMIEARQQRIYSLKEDKLQRYMHSEILIDCISNSPMTSYAY